MEVMNPEHPLWENFCERLEGPEGCNFHYSDETNIVWTCGGGKDKTLAQKILETIPDVDVAGSLQYFEDHGGYCDCEILFNVAG